MFHAPQNKDKRKVEFLDCTTKFNRCVKIPILITALSSSIPVIARSAAQSKFERLSPALQSNPKLRSTVPKQRSGLRHRLLRELSTPSEGRFALFCTFVRGRFSCCHFYPGWRSPRKNGSMTWFLFRTAYPGLFKEFPYGEAIVERW